jgi:hypothetical protein
VNVKADNLRAKGRIFGDNRRSAIRVSAPPHDYLHRLADEHTAIGHFDLKREG